MTVTMTMRTMLTIMIMMMKMMTTMTIMTMVILPLPPPPPLLLLVTTNRDVYKYFKARLFTSAALTRRCVLVPHSQFLNISVTDDRNGP